MGYYASAYSICLADVAGLDLVTSRLLVDEALRDFLADEDVNLEVEEVVLKAIFGLEAPPAGHTYSLIKSFRWLGETCGTRIPSRVEMPAIWKLEIETSFGENPPPFGFVEPDESVSYMTYAQMLRERVALDGCEMDVACYDFPEEMARLRSEFLSWLDYCLERKSDLLSIEC
ncbi:hypothetical protein ACYFX5_00715 [Bremerella sp. T1]|uniref:hypothetical protein n=1 Tax=Bremerella sp. TYQ1 TaxID=3119568 RepID=UPI001CC970A1|nr:hypothetical protein [Bremerella volcania]UBM36812.1 hypothetical protein LA756_02675 [Bremerella volcania]